MCSIACIDLFVFTFVLTAISLAKSTTMFNASESISQPTLQIVNESNGFDLASVISDLNVAVDNFNRRGSGFVLECIKHFVICITQYHPLHGGSSYIPTPQWLKNKRCVINIENGQTQNVSSGAYWRTFISRSTIKSGYTITKGKRTR